MNEKRKKGKLHIGITIGDVNGIGPEVILKTYADARMLEYGIPVIYGIAKGLQHYRRQIEGDKIPVHVAKYQNNSLQLQPKAINLVSCWDQPFEVQPGTADETAGKIALRAIDEAVHDLQTGQIDVLVTAPVNKATVRPEKEEFTGHTEYIARQLGGKDSLMILTHETFKMGLVTHHIPLKDISAQLNIEKIYQKIKLYHDTLVRDFGISRPKLAVFGLNPHAGDNGLLGKEEKEIIIPAIKRAQGQGIAAYGPYAADGLMGSGGYKQFDGILAMYHDQGLVAFKSLFFSSGVNYTGGLPYVRTSPDHGTGYDIAGKGLADPGSFMQAIFLACDIYHQRIEHDEMIKNPLKRKELQSEDRVA